MVGSNSRRMAEIFENHVVLISSATLVFHSLYRSSPLFGESQTRLHSLPTEAFSLVCDSTAIHIRVFVFANIQLVQGFLLGSLPSLMRPCQFSFSFTCGDTIWENAFKSEKYALENLGRVHWRHNINMCMGLLCFRLFSSIPIPYMFIDRVIMEYISRSYMWRILSCIQPKDYKLDPFLRISYDIWAPTCTNSFSYNQYICVYGIPIWAINYQWVQESF